MKLSAALLFLTTSVVNVNSSEYLALRGQKRRAAVVGFEDEDVHVELPTPEMGVQDEEDFPVPDVYSRSEEFGTLEETGEGEAEGEEPEDDGTTDGGGGREYMHM